MNQNNSNNIYHLQMKLREGNVSMSTGGGFSPPPPGGYVQGVLTPRNGYSPPGWVCPGATHSLRVGMWGDGYSPPPIHGTVDTMGYGPQADGMYPTGMLSSCLLIPPIKNSFCSILVSEYVQS